MNLFLPLVTILFTLPQIADAGIVARASAPLPRPVICHEYAVDPPAADAARAESP